jgi:hypothetical protein
VSNALAYFDISQLGPDDLASIAEGDGDAMHVRLADDGPWHRRAVNRIETVTACGETLPRTPAMGWYHTTLRKASYEGPLCPACFTPFELAEAEHLAGIERLRSLPDSSNTNTGEDQ